MLDVKKNRALKSNEHVEDLCRKDNQYLHAL